MTPRDRRAFHRWKRSLKPQLHNSSLDPTIETKHQEMMRRYRWFMEAQDAYRIALQSTDTNRLLEEIWSFHLNGRS